MTSNRRLSFNISEQKYLLLIACIFLSIAVIVGLLIWGFEVIPLGYISIFTSSIFLVFTIVFLSVLLKVREKAEWNPVKRTVLRRYSNHLLNLSDMIVFYFLDEEDDTPLKELVKIALKDKYEREHTVAECKTVLSYYAEHPIKFSTWGGHFFESWKLEEITGTQAEFEKEAIYFEHLLSGYSNNLSSKIMNGVMSIQDNIDEILKTYDVALKFEKQRNRGKPPASISVERAKSNFSNTLQELAKNIVGLNEEEIGFII